MIAPAHPNRSCVAVYRGEGAGWRSVQSTVASCVRLLPQPYKVVTIAASELLAGGWQRSCALLVMPGGADLPYAKHLNGKGNALIAEFVRSGGSYLGLCAGAYYACSRVEFEPGGALEVVGDRELAFFPGIARGSIVPGFDYQTERGAAAVQLRYAGPSEVQELLKQQQQRQQWRQQQQEQWNAAGSGGHKLAGFKPSNGFNAGGWDGSGGAQSSSSSNSSDSNSSSGSSSSRGSGWASRWQETLDYCNGGPFFLSPWGQPDWEDGIIPGVDVLARYVGVAPAELDRARPQRGSSHAAAAAGAGHGAAEESQAEGAPAVTAVAALRCRVGAGAAVLCGTHPELEPGWLDVCGMTQTAAAAAENAAASATAAATSQAAAAAVAASTQASQGMRRAGVSFGSSTAALAGAAAGAFPVSSGSVGAAGSLDSCPDIQLARHTAALRGALAADQAHRDDLMRSLLLAALLHQNPAVVA